MDGHNSERFVHIGDRQFVDFRDISAVYPVEESTDDDFAQMMNQQGLYKRSVVHLQDGTMMTSTEQVEVIMARLDMARDPDSDASLSATYQQVAEDTMEALANEIENALPGLDRDSVAVVKSWLFQCLEATRGV